MYVILALIAAIGLAKHGGKPKRRYSLKRVRITPERSLTTLGSDTVLIATISGTGDLSYRAVTVKGTWTLSGLTAGEGPITVGYAHSDYTVAEIKECLEANLSVNQGEKISNERANRLVRVVGTFAPTANSALNDGKPIKTRLNWLISVSDSVNLFAFNEGTGALTTGATVNLQGDLWIAYT